MTTLEKITELRAKIDELEAQLKSESEPMFEKIERGDGYFWVSGGFDLDIFTNRGDETDNKLVLCNNAFTNKSQAQACADYLKDRFWFIRKSIEFADGYEFVEGANNYYPAFNGVSKEWCKIRVIDYQASNIHMSGDNADKFIAWLSKHKPNGWN